MVLAGVIPVDHEIFAFFVANRDVCFYFFFGKKKKMSRSVTFFSFVSRKGPLKRRSIKRLAGGRLAGMPPTGGKLAKKHRTVLYVQ